MSNIQSELTVILCLPGGSLRKALPIRAIPFVTCWQRFSPDIIPLYLSRRTDTLKHSTTLAYYLSDGAITPKQPQEWEQLTIDIRAYESKLRRKRIRKKTLDNELLSRAEIRAIDTRRKEVIRMLPAGEFVWLDEFEQDFKTDNKAILFELEHLSNADLVLAPKNPSSPPGIIMEGFDIGDKLRTNSLDSLITKAIRQAGNMKPNDVYLVLKEMALDEDPPFSGIVDGKGGLEYTGNNNKKEKLTRESIKMRLLRRKKYKNIIRIRHVMAR